MGGNIPEHALADNMKSVVTGRDAEGRPVWQKDYAEFMRAVSFKTKLCKPYHPFTKGKIENEVRDLERYIAHYLEGCVFSSLDEVNEAISALVAEVNARSFRDRRDVRKSRDEAFSAYDLPAMAPLPLGRFGTCDYKGFGALPNNYHVYYDEHYYSVPWQHIGKPLMLKATFSKVLVCTTDNRLICSHQRPYAPFPRYVTDDDHMSAGHRFAKEANERDGDYYRRWAASYGKSTHGKAAAKGKGSGRQKPPAHDNIRGECR